MSYREDRTARLLRAVSALLDRAARHLTYRGGERSPRFMVERAADWLIFTAIFRAWGRS